MTWGADELYYGTAVQYLGRYQWKLADNLPGKDIQVFGHVPMTPNGIHGSNTNPRRRRQCRARTQEELPNREKRVSELRRIGIHPPNATARQ